MKVPGAMLYKNYLNSLQFLSDNEFRRFICAMVDYASESIAPEFDERTLNVLWEMVKNGIDRDIAKYYGKSENAKKAANARWSKTTPIESIDYGSIENTRKLYNRLKAK